MSSSFVVGARSYLFAPGNSEKLLGRVFTAGADAVILDLEDAVVPQEKDRARALVAGVVANLAAGGAQAPAQAQAPARAPGGGRGERPVPETFVRVNGLESGRTQADIAAVVAPGLRGIRLPKVESAAQVREVSAWIAAAERAAGLTPGSVRLDCTIETARGVAAAMAIANVEPSRVGALIFGPADFLRDIGVEPEAPGDGAAFAPASAPAGLESLYARSQIVIASRVAGIGAPIDGAYTRLKEPDGLRRSALEARRLGYFGKSAIHPEQLSVIHEVFSPTTAQIEAARAVVDAFERAAAAGVGAIQLPDGQFVDEPIAQRARRTLALAARTLPT